MCTTFTEHVLDFGPNCDPAGCVLPRLEQLLRQRMRRKNLLTAPPAYLGYGVPSWDATGAFEDVAGDCYAFAILDRLQGLRNQLRVRPNIDGLIVRNVDSFLLERQRRNDPVGYAVFGNVERAASELAAVGELAVEEAVDGRLHGSSLLRLDPSAPAAGPADTARTRETLIHAPGWAEVLPELVSTTEQGQEWIAGFLRRLRAAGVAAVRVGDLVSVLSEQARGDWIARHAVHEGELGFEGDNDFGEVVRLVWPDARAVDRDQWEMLKRVVPERIGRLDRQQRVRDRLAEEFRELVRLIESGGPSPPSQADLVRRLGLARETVSTDFRLLRDLLAEILTPNPDG
jgi:hypothetical protein